MYLKANTVADISEAVFNVPPVAVMLDGSLVAAEKGGIIHTTVDGRDQYYSLAAPNLVADGIDSANAGLILKRRVGRVTLNMDRFPRVTTMGGEVEWLVVDEVTGEYCEGGYNNEAFVTQAEDSTSPVSNSEELEAQYSQVASRNIAKAAARGIRLVPTSVYGQRGALQDELNPHPYVLHTLANMEEVTGFSPAEVMRVCGVQFHTGISNTLAALKAGEAMQLLTPILVAPSLSGPFLLGGLAERLKVREEFNAKQRSHLGRMGMLYSESPGDALDFEYWDNAINIDGSLDSWRYLMRRAASPGAGIWVEPSPGSLQEYLSVAHAKLAAGISINTVDRYFGPHADRVRLVLDGTDATTFESCAYDTFAGNPQMMADHHVLYSAVFTALEHMAMQGVDVVDEVSRRLIIHELSREERLSEANRQMMRVTRSGTSATAYGLPIIEWVKSLILPLAKEAPYLELDPDRVSRLIRSFGHISNWAIKKFNRRNGTTPSIRDYYALGISSPSRYLELQYQSLPDDKSALEKVRQIELDMGNAYHETYGVAA